MRRCTRQLVPDAVADEILSRDNLVTRQGSNQCRCDGARIFSQHAFGIDSAIQILIDAWFGRQWVPAIIYLKLCPGAITRFVHTRQSSFGLVANRVARSFRL